MDGSMKKAKKSKPTLHYEIRGGYHGGPELVIYEVRNNRRDANTAYKIRQVGSNGYWRGLSSQRLCSSFSEVKKCKIKQLKDSIRQTKEWLRMEEKGLAQLQKMKAPKKC